MNWTFKPAKSGLSAWLFWSGTLLWSALVLWRYFPPAFFRDFSFLAQFNLDLGQARLAAAGANFMAVLPAWTWDFALILTFWAWGKRLGLWIGLPQLPLGLKIAFQTALGIVFFNSLWLGLGLNGLWFKSLFLILSLLFMGPALLFLSKDLWEWKRSTLDISAWPLAGTPFLLAMVLFLFALAQSLVPEIYFDGLVYHLSVLQFWWDRHGILDFAANFHSYYPFGAELYFLNGFWLGSGEGAKLLNVFSLALAVLAAVGWVAEESGAALGWLCGASLLFVPWVSTTVWTTQNEIVLTFFLLLFFYALRRWARAPTSGQKFRWVLLAGIAGGAALSVKYTAAPAFLAAGFALAVENPKVFKKDRLKEWFLLAVFLLGALGPWLLKNFLYTGNFLYPYFSQWLGGRGLSPERLQELLVNHESVFGTGGGTAWWKWPYELAAHHLDKTMGPFLFCFIPFLVMGIGVWKKERYLLVLGVLYLMGGFLISYQTRLMIPEMALFFVGAGCFLGKLKDPWAGKIWAALLILLGLTTLLSLARLSAQYVQGQKLWLGTENREKFLETSPQTDSYYSLTRACERLAPRDRVLVVGDARGLYYPRAYLANSVFDDPELVKIARQSPDAEGIRRRLQQEGVDDLAVSGEEEMRLSRLYPQAYALTTAQWKNLDDFIERGTDLVYLEGPQALYHLRPALSPRSKPIPDLLLLLPNSKANP
jgi:4-amino-4-deoxy-L-arabinose transferase-like glycosyltransferase